MRPAGECTTTSSEWLSPTRTSTTARAPKVGTTDIEISLSEDRIVFDEDDTALE
jgi:hypothetical protein